jgi:hypothetical protein
VSTGGEERQVGVAEDDRRKKVPEPKLIIIMSHSGQT